MDYPGVALASSIAVDWKVILVDFGQRFNRKS
jgi:hypothetical protein